MAVQALYKDDEVLDFINEIKNPQARKAVLKMLDSLQEDLQITLRHEDLKAKVVRYHVIFKAVNEQDGGLIMYSAETPEEMLGFLRKVLRSLPASAHTEFAIKIENIYLGLLNLDNDEQQQRTEQP